MATDVPDDLWLLDAHCDSMGTRFVLGDPLNLSPVERDYHVTLPRMSEGRIRAVCAMVGEGELQQSLGIIDGVYETCAAHPDEMAVCRSAAQVREAVAAGRLAVIMTIEGQSMFGERVEQVRNWQRLGVCIYNLTHGEGTAKKPGALQVSLSHFGYLSPQERDALRRESKGLTDFGRQAVAEMGRIGVPCDLAHANDVAFWEVIENGTGPVCVTHGSCAALCPHTRNLTDDMLRALAERGGVIGVCFYGPFIDSEAPTLERYVDHVMHALELTGEDGVGIGTDFDGVPEGAFMAVPEPSRMGDLWEALDRRGVSREAMVKIAHENFLRLLPR